MAALAGVKLIFLDEEKAVAIVPFRRRNKNPFKSMYFAVQSMAAELSTASLAMLALKSLEADVALIITENRAEFNKKAQTEISFTCVDYSEFKKAFEGLTPGRQRAYNLYFTAAKQSKTRVDRIEKYTERILSGKGINDCVCGKSKRMPNCDGSHKYL